MKDLFTKTNKTLMRDVKYERVGRQYMCRYEEFILRQCMRRYEEFILLKNLLFPKGSIHSKQFLSNFLDLFSSLKKKITPVPQIHMIQQKALKSRKNLHQQKKIGSIILYGFKIYSKSIIIKNSYGAGRKTDMLKPMEQD